MQQGNNDIVIIGVPFRSGCNREGAQYAPKWLIDKIPSYKDACHVLQFLSENVPLTDIQSNGIKNYNAVCQMKNKLKECVNEAISEGKKVVTIGGDHSVAIGSIAGLLQIYPNLGVIWFDAHTDINTETSSPSGNAHGMPLAALMGLCKSAINEKECCLNPQNIFWIGVRDIDDGEWEIIRTLGIEDHVYTSEMVHKLGMNNIMAEVREKLYKNGVKYLHLSFDIDGMDPNIIPATGTPVPNGVTDTECHEFIYEIEQNMPQLVSMDFVEYNPLMDNEIFATGEWCKNTLKNLIGIISK